jgi:RNA-directed DNA polymerase
MQQNLINRVHSHKTLGRAWTAIRKNGRLSKSEATREEIAAFEAEAIDKIVKIQRQLQIGSFKFPPVIGKKILKKNKKGFRPLVIAPLESRIVQRAIHDVLVGLPTLQIYVKTPYSFGGIRKDRKDEIAAVPAAIQSVLDAIGNGSQFIKKSDISDFFTKVPKSKVTAIIEGVVSDEKFLKLFGDAIVVELENMQKLRHDANAFPIEDIGVAQGNSLSPLLGNLYLYDFDQELNKSTNIRCFRYIDDFIILAPTKEAADAHFKKALAILKQLGLTVSKDKTIEANAAHGFEFLGIEIVNGFIRPSKESRKRLMDSIESILSESKGQFNSYLTTRSLDSRYALINTLKKISGVMQGWGKHYWFCNDANCLDVMNTHVSKLIREYLRSYAQALKVSGNADGSRLMGLEPLAVVQDRKFLWQKPNAVPKN